MIKRKIKDWAIPTLGIIVLLGAILCYYLLNNIIGHNLTVDDFYTTDILTNNTINVNKEETTVVNPYEGENITISKYFYQKEDTEEKQQKSLIKYENIYMPNTGILYSSDKKFNIIAVLDGKIANIKEDKILGNIIEIEHSDNYYTIYQSLDNVQVKVGDIVKKGDVIASSGSNKLEDEKDNCLHFEVYKNGSLVNPESLIKNEKK